MKLKTQVNAWVGLETIHGLDRVRSYWGPSAKPGSLARDLLTRVAPIGANPKAYRELQAGIDELVRRLTQRKH